MAHGALAQTAEVLRRGNSGQTLELLHDGELVALRLFAEALEHGGGELVGRRGGEHHDRRVSGVRRLVLLRDVPRHGGVRVAEIMMLLPDPADGPLRLGVAAAARPEEGLNFLLQLLRHLVGAVLGELTHQLRHHLLVAGEQEQQALEVARHQNVHRGRAGEVERALFIVAARADKVGEHVVGVGRAHERADGKPQLAGEVAGENVAEVAGGNDVVHPLADGDRAAADKVCVSAEVIDDLRGKAADVDGVRARQAHTLAREQVLAADLGKDLLDGSLRVVEVAAHRGDTGIVAALRDHLRLLHSGHTAVWVKDDDLRARDVAETLHRGLAGVAGGRGEDQNFIVHAALLLCRRHQVRQHRERHILEGARGAAEQLEHRVLTDRNGGGQVLGLEFAGVGGMDKLLHLRVREVGQQRA